MNQNQENIQEKDPKKDYILSPYYQSFKSAYQYISFSPEKRAESDIKGYSEMLEQDLKQLQEKGGTGKYQEKFISKLLALMSAKSRCVSWMITGPSGLNANRVNKANETERKKSDDFWSWRKKYFKAVDRVPTLPPEDELKNAEEKLIWHSNLQEEYKEINKEIRINKFNQNKTPFIDIITHLRNLGISEEALQGIKENPDGSYIIPSYRLTNNNAVIKNTQEKVKVMLARIERKNTWKDILFEGGRITLEDDRIKIFHDEKPNEEIRKIMKENGFKYSPHWVCWCRKHTSNAIYVINQIKDRL